MIKPNDITIDPEFRDLIPPLAEEERKRLEDSLSACGMLSPIILWRTEGKLILIDGHNRLELWKKRDGFDPEFEFKTTDELLFGDREDAKQWIIKNQLGRRNLSPENFQHLLGMLYSSRKKAGFKGNQHTSGDGQNVHQQNSKLKTTAQQIAEEFDVSERTVRRAGKMVEQAEELRKEEPELSLPEAVKKVRKQKKANPTPKPPKPELSPEEQQAELEKLLEKRWEKFIKEIPVTSHSAVREWLTQKLKQTAL
jgi:hypothetical protein